MDIYKVCTVNGIDIFFDMYTNRYFYWENAKKRTSVLAENLRRRILGKQSKQ